MLARVETVKSKKKLKMFQAAVVVTRAEEWCVEAETAEEARELLVSGGGHRCHIGDVDPSGVRTLCSYLLLREQVIKPLLAGVVRPRARPPKVRNPLDQHYVALRQELNRTFETIGLAAA